MRKKTILFFGLMGLSFSLFGQAVITVPSPIEVDQPVTITIDENTTATDCNHLNNPNKVYMHAGIGDDNNPWMHVVGNWGQDDGVGEMTDNGDGTWSITITPKTYFGLSDTEAAQMTKMGMVFRNEDGSQEYKDNGCQDFILNVGAFQVTMINPDDSGVILVDNGGGTQILAQNTNGNADYDLYANGTLIHSQHNTNFYNGYLFQNLTENQYCELVVTQGTHEIHKHFMILVDNTVSQNMPVGLDDGINYDNNDTGRATLVLTAPGKDFVYVAGSFNNWQPGNAYAMKKDPTTDKFWVEITGLVSDSAYTYQYWVADKNPPSDSPKLVKTADPFSTLVLSPYDDPYIPASHYPNMPEYPWGQEREVTVLETGQTPYVWHDAGYARPAKEDLLIYEVLIRDFDSTRTFQDLIDRVDYFANLHVTAIELMPVMEFEGNLGWGYNPAFHMALDKFYGPKEKLQELVDVFHQHGIAVILDIALDHATGRNPMERMWMTDADGDGWGPPASDNPYFNQQTTHAYGIDYDLNHSSPYTQHYTERVIKHWIETFHIDGFRWDLTKGFTQNCSPGDEACTNNYQQDRVDILKHYADYTWSIDPDSYVIFEHLGNAQEEQTWADYRLNEGKGIMLWGRNNDPYGELLMGQSGNRDISGMGHTAHNFAGKRLVGFFESHDEERVMYKALQYGNSSNASHDVTDLNTALFRMRALGAVSLLIPGPKMIWHFSDLGMEQSLYTCSDGTVDPNCRLDTKPQPQWVNNWLHDPHRSAIYNDWARMMALKTFEPVFKGDYAVTSGDFTPKIYIWDDNIPATQLKNVVIVANFDVVQHSVTPYFPYTGTWYNLMDNSSVTVNNTNDAITLGPGEYRIFGNQPTQMAVNPVPLPTMYLYPNPSRDYMMLSEPADRLEIYDISGKLLISKENISANTVISLQNIAPGIYSVKMHRGVGRKTMKLIVQP